MYILNTHQDLSHSVHQLARVVHNPGPSHFKTLDHVLFYLSGTVGLCFIVGNWTAAGLQYPAGFHANVIFMLNICKYILIYIYINVS